MSGRLSEEVKTHIEKARESAILAVDVYNKPATTFRSGAYIVLMCIAWTALFHAIAFKRKVKPFYRRKDNPKFYVKIDGDYKGWELSECLNYYYESNNPPERENIKFFIGLRNKIEHRSMPALDSKIFGECQSLLLNFEDVLFREFGPKYALNENLSLALQFSQFRDENQDEAIKKKYRPLGKDISKYINEFRSTLATEHLQDMWFSYKVILIEVGNHAGLDTPAVQFVKYDPSNLEAMEKLQHFVAMIKPVVKEAINKDRYRATQIANAVEPIVKQAAGNDKKFGVTHHTKAWKFYKIRPRSGDTDPYKTDTRYCLYDETHNDYVYTREWQKFLINEMKKPGKYEEVMKNGI